MKTARGDGTSTRIAGTITRMRRVLLAAAIAVVAAATVGLLVSAGDDDELRRVGLPTLDETVATVLEDSTPVFVTRDPADEVQVIDARTPPRSVPEGGAALPDLVQGLVAWCAAGGFVDDLAPPATFAFDGRATGPTDAGLGIYEIAERARAHVMVGDARPADGTGGGTSAGEGGQPSELVAECEDPERTDDHGQAMHETEVDAIRAGPSWVVEAAVDLGADVLCEPPEDPLAWPLCPDGGVPVDLPDRRPAPDLVEEHGQAYAERDAFAFVGRFLVRREEDGAPLQDVWRLPYQVAARAQPREHRVEARLRLDDDTGEGSAAATTSTVTGDAPLATVAVDDADGDVPDRLPFEPVTELVADDGSLTGEEALAALGEALEADPDARWELRVRHDPLRPPRLERLERTDEPLE